MRILFNHGIQRQDNTRVVTPHIDSLDLNKLRKSEVYYTPAINVSDNTRTTQPVVNEIDFNNPVLHKRENMRINQEVNQSPSTEQKIPVVDSGFNDTMGEVAPYYPWFSDENEYARNTQKMVEAKQDGTYVSQTTEDVDPKRLSGYVPQIYNEFADIGTGITHGMQTLGGSLVGNAVKAFSPQTADWLNRNTYGLITTTPDEMYAGNRPGAPNAWNNRINSVSKGVTSVVGSAIVGGAMNAASKPIAGALNRRAFRRLPERLLTAGELSEANYVLATKGILPSQRNMNPLKHILNKAVEPSGYKIDLGVTGNRITDITGYIKNSRNPRFMQRSSKYPGTKTVEIMDKTPRLRKTLNELYNARFDNIQKGEPFGNRAITWDMYLGHNQLKHPIYKVSPLSTNRNTVYTIKKGATNQHEVMDNISHRIRKWYTPDAKTKVLSGLDQGYFNTMGGHNWKLDVMDNGNVQVLARDMWDLHPFEGFGKNATGSGIKDRLIRKIAPSIRNMEVGKTLRVGKPLDVKVGFEFSPEGQIIKQFNLGGILKKYKK